jgi:hypothetical protein
VGEGVGGRRLADPVGADEGDLGATGPGGHALSVAASADRRCVARRGRAAPFATCGTAGRRMRGCRFPASPRHRPASNLGPACGTRFDGGTASAVLRSRRSQQDGTEGEMLRRGGTLAATATTPVAGAPEAPEKRAAAAGAPRSAADATVLDALVARAQAGDRAAFEQLVERRVDRAFRGGRATRVRSGGEARRAGPSDTALGTEWMPGAIRLVPGGRFELRMTLRSLDVELRSGTGSVRSRPDSCPAGRVAGRSRGVE